MFAIRSVRWRFSLLAVVGALFGALLVAAPTEAAFPGYDGRIAILRSYIVTVSGGSQYYQDLWTIRPNGTDARELTNGLYIRDADYSRDGSKIAFVADGKTSPYMPELFVINSDGTGQARVPVPTSLYVVTLDWVDGDTLVISTRSGIYSVELSGGDPALLVNNVDGGVTYTDRNVAVSPDGTSMVWSRDSTVHDGTRWVSSTRLMRASIDGSSQEVLFEPNETHNTYGMIPDWGPDGATLDWRHFGNDGFVWHRLNADDGSSIFRRIDNSTLNRIQSPSGQYMARSDSVYKAQITDADGNTVYHLPKDPNVTRDWPVSWQPAASGLSPLDFVKPTITVTSPDGEQVEQGSNLAAAYSCADDRELASCEGTVANGASLNTSELGTKSFSVTATDTSGNIETREVSYQVVEPVVTDEIAPTVSFTPADGTDVLMGESLVVSYACADEQGGSGIASCAGSVPSGSSLDTSTVGQRTVSVTATDNAGNSRVASASYDIIWPFGGFTGPVNGGTTVNSTKAGGVVPVKFSLGGDRGLAVLATGYPKSVKVDCQSSSTVDPLEAYATSSPGNNTLSYDASTDTYAYNWKTEKSWSNSCRNFVLRLTDGSQYQAKFQFK